MTVTVTGGSGAITYQWQQSADGSTGWANSTGKWSNNSYLYTIECSAREQLIIEYWSIQPTMDVTRL
jgi:hypothetical protein